MNHLNRKFSALIAAGFFGTCAMGATEPLSESRHSHKIPFSSDDVVETVNFTGIIEEIVSEKVATSEQIKILFAMKNLDEFNTDLVSQIDENFSVLRKIIFKLVTVNQLTCDDIGLFFKQMFIKENYEDIRSILSDNLIVLKQSYIGKPLYRTSVNGGSTFGRIVTSQIKNISDAVNETDDSSYESKEFFLDLLAHLSSVRGHEDLQVEIINYFRPLGTIKKSDKSQNSGSVQTQKSKPVETSSYVGKSEDDKWWRGVTYDMDMDEVYQQLVGHSGIFRWQHPYGFQTHQNQGLNHIKPIWKNIKEEALHNPYEPLSVDNWNQTLRKSKIFHQSWAAKRIRTKQAGFYEDKISGSRIEWDANEEISMQEIVALKLYTDFDKLQFALKKCHRFESTADILGFEINDFEQLKRDLNYRLRNFYHWRLMLLQVLHKYGTQLNSRNNMTLYHGVNEKMILKRGKTFHMSGPLSTTSSYHVARTFATAKGMVLKIAGRFPRLPMSGLAFDASLISDYPEEQEWLLGSLYSRLIEVRTRKLQGSDVRSFSESQVPLSSQIREIWFALHLIGEQIYSMSEHLEANVLKLWRASKAGEGKSGFRKISDMKPNLFLDVNNSYKLGQTLKSIAKLPELNIEEIGKSRMDGYDGVRLAKSLDVIWEKFNDFRMNPNVSQNVKIDVLSPNLKQLFMDQSQEIDINLKTKKWKISYEKIAEFYPNVKSIDLWNQYQLTDSGLAKIIKLIESKDKGNHLNKINFLYFNYKYSDENKMPKNAKIFINPDTLNSELISKLQMLNWDIKHSRYGSGYRIQIYKK